MGWEEGEKRRESDCMGGNIGEGKKEGRAEGDSKPRIHMLTAAYDVLPYICLTISPPQEHGTAVCQWQQAGCMVASCHSQCSQHFGCHRCPEMVSKWISYPARCPGLSPERPGTQPPGYRGGLLPGLWHQTEWCLRSMPSLDRQFWAL